MNGIEGRPFSDAYASLDALRALAEAWNASPPMQRLGARLEFQRVDRAAARALVREFPSAVRVASVVGRVAQPLSVI